MLEYEDFYCASNVDQFGNSWILEKERYDDIISDVQNLAYELYEPINGSIDLAKVNNLMLKMSEKMNLDIPDNPCIRMERVS